MISLRQAVVCIRGNRAGAAAERQRALDLGQQRARFERLREIAEDAAFHRGDRVRYRAVRREDDDRQRGVLLPYRFEERHAVHAAHSQIGHDDARAGDGELCERALGALGGGHGVARSREPDLHEPQQIGIVVDDEDAGTRCGAIHGVAIIFGRGAPSPRSLKLRSSVFNASSFCCRPCMFCCSACTCPPSRRCSCM